MRKEQILELRSQGYTYNQIAKELGCNKGLISYHCGKGVKEKSYARQRKMRAKRKESLDVCLNIKTSSFKDRTREFRRRKSKDSKSLTSTEAKQVIKLQKSRCYLTGLPLTPENLSFDHIIPYSKGGSNLKENLGILLWDINYMKGNLTVNELLDYCEKILVNFNYKVERPKKIKGKVKFNKGSYSESYLASLQ